MPIIEVDWKTLNKFPWEAIFRCGQEYKRENPDQDDPDYTTYLRDTWGIAHATHEVRVVDEQKYMMFLLRWS